MNLSMEQYTHSMQPTIEDLEVVLVQSMEHFSAKRAERLMSNNIDFMTILPQAPVCYLRNYKYQGKA